MGAMVRNNSFSIYAGQVTGIFGLIGSGRTETAKIIAGVQKRNMFNGGDIKYGEGYVRYRVPRPAVQDGIVYITEDRKLEGFFETMTISENIHASLLASGQKSSSIVRKSEADRIAAHWSKRLNIRAVNGDTHVIELSGGNQQKVVIASGLAQQPRLVIFDEPTRGVDVGAIAEIHEIIGTLEDGGLAVMVISSYLPEIMNISDRILVSRMGRIVEEFTPGETSEEQIMYASVH
jgi:simple sugar transport system ATP-binding protein